MIRKKPRAREPLLLVDLSNGFTKIAVASGGKIGTPFRIPTRELSAPRLQTVLADAVFERVILASVVPSRSGLFRRAFEGRLLEVNHTLNLGYTFDLDTPETIGADRLANAAAVARLFGFPGISIDFGTAVTFEVLNAKGSFCGGMIAPGLDLLADSLHHRTALLPRIDLEIPRGVLGKSTGAAMQSGVVFGFAGMVREILTRLRASHFPTGLPPVIATGGNAKIASRLMPEIFKVDSLLTLKGLQIIAENNP